LLEAVLTLARPICHCRYGTMAIGSTAACPQDVPARVRNRHRSLRSDPGNRILAETSYRGPHRWAYASMNEHGALASELGADAEQRAGERVHLSSRDIAQALAGQQESIDEYHAAAAARSELWRAIVELSPYC